MKARAMCLELDRECKTECMAAEPKSQQETRIAAEPEAQQQSAVRHTSHALSGNLGIWESGNLLGIWESDWPFF